jgi:transglutaminase-like putative cysteine protease
LAARPVLQLPGTLVFPEKVTEFKVTVDLVVDMSVYNPFDFFLEPDFEEFPFVYTDVQKQELGPYLALDKSTPLLDAYVQKIDMRKRRTIDFLVGINQQVANDVKYLIRMEPGVQTPEETLELASGSCRDSPGCWCRCCGAAAWQHGLCRGYLIQLTPM